MKKKKKKGDKDLIYNSVVKSVVGKRIIEKLFGRFCRILMYVFCNIYWMFYLLSYMYENIWVVRVVYVLLVRYG